MLLMFGKMFDTFCFFKRMLQAAQSFATQEFATNH